MLLYTRRDQENLQGRGQLVIVTVVRVKLCVLFIVMIAALVSCIVRAFEHLTFSRIYTCHLMPCRILNDEFYCAPLFDFAVVDFFVNNVLCIAYFPVLVLLFINRSDDCSGIC